MYIYIYMYAGRGSPNGSSGCSVPPLLSLDFPPHCLEILVMLKASGPPHVLILWFGVSKGMFPVRYFHSTKTSSLYQSNFF